MPFDIPNKNVLTHWRKNIFIFGDTSILILLRIHIYIMRLDNSSYKTSIRDHLTKQRFYDFFLTAIPIPFSLHAHRFRSPSSVCGTIDDLSRQHRDFYVQQLNTKKESHLVVASFLSYQSRDTKNSLACITRGIPRISSSAYPTSGVHSGHLDQPSLLHFCFPLSSEKPVPT